MRSSILQVLRGFAMGSADLVPGVSGGTVALVLGIYRRLVGAIRTGSGALGSLIKLDLAGFRERLRAVDWGFLVPLLIGIGLAVVTLSNLIHNLLDTQPVRMAGLFFGLVAASIVVTWRLISDRDLGHYAIVVVSAVVTFFVLGLRAGPVSNPSLWTFLAAGAVAICAMILPGISGSFILLMLGMYEAVIGAVTERDMAIIAVFGLGAIVGLASFSTLLHKLLAEHSDPVMAVLVGLMAGSLRVLWPWPEGTAGTTLGAPDGDVVAPVVLALIGAGVVLFISRREDVIDRQIDNVDDVDEGTGIRS